MDPIDKLIVDGYTYWKITPIEEIPQAYAKLVFNPGIYGMSIALFSIAIWLALDLIFQVFVTFRRWGGIYFWTVLITSIGVGIHACSLVVKMYTPLTITEDIGTTVLVKAGDVLTQTGFSLVLFSRLNLVMRTQKQAYLKWILVLILVSSFLVHTPTIIFTLGINTRHMFWFQHARVAEKFVVIWYTLLELSLSAIYTYNTARLSKDSAVLHAHGAMKNQSRKTRHYLLLFMVFAQVVTFTFDMTLVVLTCLELMYKAMLMPFCYGVKLKIEFMALNQLQSLVQPNVNMFQFTGEQNVPAQAPHNANLALDVEAAGALNEVLSDKGCESKDCESPLHKVESPESPASPDSDRTLAPEASAGQASRVQLQRPMVQISQVSSTGSISELERQYLGRRDK